MIKVNSTVIEQNHFPDGTLLLKTEDFRGYKDSVKIEWHYESDAELFTIICLAKKAPRKELFLPYIPHARQDRVKHGEDTFTLRYFAEVINSLDFETVTVLDPHSTVSEALIDRIVIRNPKQYADMAIEAACAECNCEELILFFPDEGASKRYANLFQLPYVFGIKKREWKTGNIQGLDVVDNGFDLQGKNVLIIDDICSRGGTFYHSAKKLKELGAAKVFLYITHCENTILEGEVLTGGLIERVFTTDSIFTKQHEKVEVFKV